MTRLNWLAWDAWFHIRETWLDWWNARGMIRVGGLSVRKPRRKR